MSKSYCVFANFNFSCGKFAVHKYTTFHNTKTLQASTQKLTEKIQYEILTSLPAYGPMYIPISDTDEPFFSEGFVVRFFKDSGTDWVGNFKEGWTKLNKVFDFPEKKRVIVFAGGLGYIIDPNNEKPIGNFGTTISDVFQTENGSLICVDGIGINILDNSNGELWESERISWDGFKDLKFENGTISGLAFDPMNSKKEWREFSLNVITKEIKGGSFRNTLNHNPNLEVKNRVEIKIKDTVTKPWWKFW